VSIYFTFEVNRNKKKNFFHTEIERFFSEMVFKLGILKFPC